eukprot:scaffold108363_cov38-Prasinocladus_malaysianus.AAC.1
MQHCRPFWLRAPGSEDSQISQVQAEEIRSLYGQISARTFCENLADKPRALCPMLTNTPVETQKELIDLVRQLNSSDLDGELLDPEAEKLLVEEEEAISRHNTNKRPIGMIDAAASESGDESVLTVPAPL